MAEEATCATAQERRAKPSLPVRAFLARRILLLSAISTVRVGRVRARDHGARGPRTFFVARVRGRVAGVRVRGAGARVLGLRRVGC